MRNIGDRGLSIIEVVFAQFRFLPLAFWRSPPCQFLRSTATRPARRLTDATALAEDRLERLAALPYDVYRSDAETEGAYRVDWDVDENVADENQNPSPLRWNAPMAGRIRRLPSGI